MKFLTYKEHNNPNQIFGFKYKEELIDINKSALYFIDKYSDDRFLSIPKTLKEALVNWDRNFLLLKELETKISQEDISSFSIKKEDALILPPVPDPPSFRDFYAFEQHVRAARKLRGLEMNPDWYKIAIFYFSNPNCCYGHK